MTWITDNNGRRWVEIPKKQRRASPRALRFADVKVGDQIMLTPRSWHYRKFKIYYVVTDLWFDPVAGQNDPLKGAMVGYAQIRGDGELTRKSATTLRGLASQGFEYADMDYIAMCKARLPALKDGTIVAFNRKKRP